METFVQAARIFSAKQRRCFESVVHTFTSRNNANNGNPKPMRHRAVVPNNPTRMRELA